MCKECKYISTVEVTFNWKFKMLRYTTAVKYKLKYSVWVE